jgi:hypothetical protein
MGTNSVYIRDLPFETLKEKLGDFFESQKFKDHENLFKSKKATAALTTPIELNNFPITILNDLRSMIKKRYVGSEAVIDGDREMMSFYYIQAQAILNNRRKQNLKLIKDVTASTSDFIDLQTQTILRRVVESPTLRRLRIAEASRPKPTIRTRPAKTGNSVKDIIESSKFYQETKNALVFDDLQYGISMLKSALSQRGLDLGEPEWELAPKKNDVAITEYPYRYEDVQSMVRIVRGLVLQKYGSDLAETSEYMNVEPELLRNALLMKLRPRVEEPPLRIVQFDTYNYTENTARFSFPVNGLDGDHFFLAGVMNAETSEFDLSPNLDLDVTSSSLRFSRKTTDEYTLFVVIAKDRYTFRISELDRKQYNIRQYEHAAVIDHWVIDMDGADDNFIIQIEQDGTLVQPITQRVVGQSRIELGFSKPVSGTAYILACIENLPEVMDVIVTEQNIEDVLNSVDFYRKVYVKWT